MLTACLSAVAPPSPPTPKVSDWTKSTVDLEWIPPLKDGGSKIIGYWVEHKEEGTEAWIKVRVNTILPVMINKNISRNPFYS